MRTLFSRITWKPSQSVVISAILILILLGAYVGIPKGIYMIRMHNIRNDYLAAYAGCEIKTFNLAVTEPDPKYPTMTVGIDNVNKNWKQDSEEWHFDHEDVVEYMMGNCSIIDNMRIDAIYPNQHDKTAKSVRDYKLKFLNKDLDVFRQ